MESATHAANSDREIKIQAQMEEEQSCVCQMRVMFQHFDANGSGTLTEKEFEFFLSKPDFQLQLRSLGIHPTEAHGLFKLLDGDQSGVVSIEEFLSGCLRLKGTAKAVDMLTLLFENAKLSRKVERIRKVLYFVPGIGDIDAADITAAPDRSPSSMSEGNAFRTDSPASAPVVGANGRWEGERPGREREPAS